MVPTSRSSAPDRRSTSGIRNPPPISTQLAAGDHHLGCARRRRIALRRPPRRQPLGERRERQQHGRGAVVDHERRLGPREPAEGAGRVAVAVAALARREVVFQVRVAHRRVSHGGDRRRGQRGATQVGVDDDPGGVHHPPQRPAGKAGEPVEEPLLDLLGGGAGQAGQDPLAQRVEGGAHRLDHRGVPELDGESRALGRGQQAVGFRELSGLRGDVGRVRHGVIIPAPPGPSPLLKSAGPAAHKVIASPVRRR